MSELLAYASHVATTVERCEDDLSKVVERGALNVKRGAQERVRAGSRGRYLPHYPKAIGYDMLGKLEAEVGPDASKLQGGMGRGVEFGSVHTGPLAHMLPAADEEEPRFGDQIGGIVARSMR